MVRRLQKHISRHSDFVENWDDVFPYYAGKLFHAELSVVYTYYKKFFWRGKSFQNFILGYTPATNSQIALCSFFTKVPYTSSLNPLPSTQYMPFRHHRRSWEKRCGMLRTSRCKAQLPDSSVLHGPCTYPDIPMPLGHLCEHENWRSISSRLVSKFVKQSIKFKAH